MRWLYAKIKLLWGFIPISVAGLFVTAACGLGLYFQAFLQLDLVVATLCLSLLGLQAVFSLLVLLRGLLLYAHVRATTGLGAWSAETGQARPGEFSVPAYNWIPFLHLQWSWKTPQAKIDKQMRQGRWIEQITFERRGKFNEVEREFFVEDVLGLAKFRFAKRFPEPVTVYPHAGKLAEPPLWIRFSTGEDISDPRGEPHGDRVDMRQYYRGDAPRTILWKVFARTRRLMVRVSERALAPRPRVCAYLVSSKEDDASAALARVVIERGLLGPEWRFGADGTAGYDTSASAALERIASSADAQKCGLAPFLTQAQTDGYAQCVVFLSLRQSDEVRNIIAQSPIPITVCIAVDGLEKEMRLPRWYHWLHYREQDSPCTLGDLEKAARDWARHPGEVMVVDRKGGVMVNDLRRYRGKSA